MCCRTAVASVAQGGGVHGAGVRGAPQHRLTSAQGLGPAHGAAGLEVEDEDSFDSAEGSGQQLDDESTYICESCGEEIVVPIDYSQGDRQEYVEDCPVCCRPNLIRVLFDAQGGIVVTAEAE